MGGTETHNCRTQVGLQPTAQRGLQLVWSHSGMGPTVNIAGFRTHKQSKLWEPPAEMMYLSVSPQRTCVERDMNQQTLK